MGKSGKKNNKVPSSLAAEAGVAACAAGPSAPSPAPTSWIDGLSEEDKKIAIGCNSLKDLQAKKEKMEVAAKKQLANQQKDMWKQEKQKQYEKEQQKETRKQGKETQKEERENEIQVQRGLKEGVVQCVWGADDKWWAQVGDKEWKEAADEYFCTLCEKNTNAWSMKAHCDSAKHISKVGWAFPGAASSAACGPAPKAPPSGSPASASGGYVQRPAAPGPGQQLEDWEEAMPDGSFKCLACNKTITDEHMQKEDHLNRVARWRETQELERSGYRAPKEEHMAWVPSVETDPTSEKWLKCLLCQKNSQDDWAHMGCVGDKDPSGSKEHLKNLRNYDWYKDVCVRDRLKWHPETARSTAAPTRSVTKAKAAPASVAPWANTASAASAAPATAAASAAVALPSGWQEAKDEDGTVFYFHPASNVTQWEKPGEDVPLPPPVEDAPLPPGWVAHKQEGGDWDGHTYYHNIETDAVQWEPPEMTEL